MVNRFIKVSVIIPVYNNSDGLKKVLESLIEQNFSNNSYEIIIADNGSSDGTLDVAKKYRENYPDLVNYVIEEKIQSSYAVRNKGIRAAKGEILAFTDSDCIPARDWLFQGLKSLRDNNVSMVAGRIEFTFRISQPNIWEYFDAAGKLNQKSYVENAGFGATANLFLRRNLFEKYGLFLDELKSGGDYEFGRRLTKSGEKLIYSKGALIKHPARATFIEKYNKSKRIAIGQKRLSEMGYLNHGQLSWRQLIPTINYKSLSDVKIGVFEELILILINNIFRYFNYYWRFTYRSSK
jgi:glycosyltransferase involved in cell wall biosynthesis